MSLQGAGEVRETLVLALAMDVPYRCFLFQNVPRAGLCGRSR